MKVELTRVDSPEYRILVDKLPAILGRDPGADVRLEDSWVGQMQCILDTDGGVLHVLDLGTRLGTFVNGHRIQQSSLLPGDHLTVGRTTFLVQYDLTPSQGAQPRQSKSVSGA